MRKLIPVFVVVATLTMASLTLARGAPPGSADQVTVSVSVAPTVANVPVMNGFDVIQNLSTPTAPHVANVQASGRGTGTALRRQSTTAAEHGFMATGYRLSRSGPQPVIVLLA